MTLDERVAEAEAAIDATLARHPGRVALACSFGGPSGMAILDMIARRDALVPVFYLDTGLLFAETHDLIARVRVRYGIEPQAVGTALSLERQAESFGPELWVTDPDRCCALRKVRPHRAFLQGFDAWFTGIRRDQSGSRAELAVDQADEDGRRRVAPLAAWSEAEVWQYVAEREVPYNALADRGYASIGCIPCTRPVGPGEHPRSGRWAGFVKTECGIHQRGVA